MPFFTKSNLVDLRAEAEQLSICVEHFLYASEHINEGDYKTKGFYDNCIDVRTDPSRKRNSRRRCPIF